MKKKLKATSLGSTEFEKYFYNEFQKELDECVIPSHHMSGEHHSWDRKAAYLVWKKEQELKSIYEDLAGASI